MRRRSSDIDLIFTVYSLKIHEILTGSSLHAHLTFNDIQLMLTLCLFGKGHV